MRIMPGFMLNEAAGEYFAIPYDDAYEAQDSIVSLNQSGAFLWELLEEETEEETLCDALQEAYKISPEIAAKAVQEFLTVLREKGLLLEQ